MVKRMLVDATHPEETRVVILNGTRLEEFDFETSTKKQLKGNIYLAKVTRVEPSLQAAFVEFGGNRHGFLAFSEIHPDYYQIPVADRMALLAEQERDLKQHAEVEEAHHDVEPPHGDPEQPEEHPWQPEMIANEPSAIPDEGASTEPAQLNDHPAADPGYAEDQHLHPDHSPATEANIASPSEEAAPSEVASTGEIETSATEFAPLDPGAMDQPDIGIAAGDAPAPGPRTHYEEVGGGACPDGAGLAAPVEGAAFGVHRPKGRAALVAAGRDLRRGRRTDRPPRRRLRPRLPGRRVRPRFGVDHDQALPGRGTAEGR